MMTLRQNFLFFLIFLPTLFSPAAADPPQDRQPASASIQEVPALVENLALGDAAWARRAAGLTEENLQIIPDGVLIVPEAREETRKAIEEAITAYEAVLEADPDHREAGWKLLRALRFQGRYLAADVEEQKTIFDQGRVLFETLEARLALSVGGAKKLARISPEEYPRHFPESDIAGIYFWGAANIGEWAQVFGKLAAVRQGVATKIRDYNLIASAIDEKYESGGGYRVLGRLHTEAPKVPFFTGWIDRKAALRYLRQAVEIDTEEPMNVYFLADALLRFEKGSEKEALEMLQELAEQPPRPTHWLHDVDMLSRVRRLLEESSE